MPCLNFGPYITPVTLPCSPIEDGYVIVPSTETHEGHIHVASRRGSRYLRRQVANDVDESFRAQLDAIASELEGPTEENRDTALRKALMRRASWADIEQAFMQSEFWERDGDPVNRTGAFSAHNGLSLVDRVRAKFGASTQSLWDKQISRLDKFVPEARKWFEELVDDADTVDALDIDMQKVCRRVVLHDFQLDSTYGPIRDEFGIMEDPFLEIDIIRFPGIVTPCVKFIRLQLTVWNQCTTSAKALSILSGIRGALSSSQFRPRANQA